MVKATLEAPQTEQLTKSDMIRQIRTENPGMGPTEVAKVIEEKYGVKVSIGMVSTVSSLDKKRGTKPAGRGRPVKAQTRSVSRMPSGNLNFDSLLKVKKLVDEVGGVEAAKNALDSLSKILA